MRDHVRASNEVMLTAGIIEETVEVTARNKAIEASIAAEMADGRRRLEVGSVILVAGVWGACSLRRRILVRILMHRKPIANTYSCTRITLILEFGRFLKERELSIQSHT